MGNSVRIWLKEDIWDLKKISWIQESAYDD